MLLLELAPLSRIRFSPYQLIPYSVSATELDRHAFEWLFVQEIQVPFYIPKQNIKDNTKPQT